MKALKNVVVKMIIKLLSETISKNWISEDRAFQLLQMLPISDATIQRLFAESTKPTYRYSETIPRCLTKYYQKIIR